MTQFQPSSGPAVAYADTETRATFLIQTYLNLLGSICAFAAALCTSLWATLF